MARYIVDDEILGALGVTADELLDMGLRTLSSLAFDKGLEIDFGMLQASVDGVASMIVTSDADVIELEHTVVGVAGNTLFYKEFEPTKVPDALRQSPCRTVLLVHGLLASSQQFEHDARKLASLGYRVLAIDLRGHGRSSVPPRYAGAIDFSPEAMMLDVVTVLDHAQARKAHWVGNSLGGILGIALAGSPHRDRLASLAIYGTAFSLSLPSIATWVFTAFFGVLGKGCAARIMAWFTSKHPPARAVVQSMIKQANLTACEKIVVNIRKYNITPSLRTYDGQILVMRASLDRAVNSQLDRQLVDLRREGKVVVVDILAAGHCANLDNPAAFEVALLKWWGEGVPN